MIERRPAGPDWNDVGSRIAPLLLSPEQIRSVLTAADAPTQHTRLGWGDEDYARALTHARFLRERFTFLDCVIPA